VQWRIGENLSFVSSGLELRWSTITLVVDSVEFQWSTLSRVAVELEARWSTLSLASADVELRWALLNTVSDSLEVQWRTRRLHVRSDIPNSESTATLPGRSVFVAPDTRETVVADTSVATLTPQPEPGNLLFDTSRSNIVRG
jgi:hypothetical protein